MKIKDLLALPLCAFVGFTQAETFHKPKVIAEFQKYSIEADGVEPAGTFFMLGAGLTIYNELGWYVDGEFLTGTNRTEVGVSLGKSFGGFALFTGYKQVATEAEIPQHGDNPFDIEESGLFLGGSWNNVVGKGTLTTSIAIAPNKNFSIEGDFYNDGAVESVDGDDTFTWSLSSAYNLRLEGSKVLSLGVKYAEVSYADTSEEVFENENASSFDEQTLSIYSKYAF